jgi:hypothetical protein
MKTAFGAVVALGLILAATAFAQTMPTTLPANPPGVGTTTADSKNAAAPVAGRNSFTEAQARSRMEAHGYTHVTRLVKDDKSIWRGKATRNGTSVNVALDYQGNIVANK